MQNKNIIIGIGNLLFCDDGVGVIAVEYLRRNYQFSDGLELLDGGTLGFNLIEYFSEYDNIYIIDTISIDDRVGEIYRIPSDKLLGGNSYKKTAHEVEVVQMLEACELYEQKAEVTIFGIVPQDITTVKIGLSKSIAEKFDALIETILKEVQTLGVEFSRKKSVELEDIIKELKYLKG